MKVLTKLTGILAFCGLLFLMSGWTSEDMGGAIVIDDRQCGLLDGDGFFVSATSSHYVMTQSNNGNGVFKCSVKKVGNSTGKAVHYDMANTGALCGVYELGLTTNWHETVSASGNATLTCLVP